NEFNEWKRVEGSYGRSTNPFITIKGFFLVPIFWSPMSGIASIIIYLQFIYFYSKFWNVNPGCIFYMFKRFRIIFKQFTQLLFPGANYTRFKFGKIIILVEQNVGWVATINCCWSAV